MDVSTFTVEGMTCDHCGAAVREELTKLAGVRLVSVDVASGSVTVRSEAPLSTDDVREAVTEAGYRLTA